MITIKDFALKNDCIVIQTDGDSGDSPQKTAFACLALNDVETYKKAYEYFKVKPGVIVRDKDQWNDVNDISRDQLEPTLIMLGQCGMKQELRAHLFTFVKHFFLYPNKDVPSPNHWPAVMIRAMELKLLYPYLLFSDLFLCINSLLFLFNGNPDDCDDDNMIARLYQSQLRGTTIFSMLAIKLYVLCRRKNNGNLLLGEKSPILGAIIWKNRPGSGGNNAMVAAWRPIFERYFT